MPAMRVSERLVEVLNLTLDWTMIPQTNVRR
jgi:hypothetical protein